jgi:hypothetical protein
MQRAQKSMHAGNSSMQNWNSSKHQIIVKNSEAKTSTTLFNLSENVVVTLRL